MLKVQIEVDRFRQAGRKGFDIGPIAWGLAGGESEPGPAHHAEVGVIATLLGPVDPAAIRIDRDPDTPIPGILAGLKVTLAISWSCVLSAEMVAAQSGLGALIWDAKPHHEKVQIAPGPNSPIGVVWLGLSKPHDGIHGMPDPSRVGRQETHGCLHLTNWDVQKLASIVAPGVAVNVED